MYLCIHILTMVCVVSLFLPSWQNPECFLDASCSSFPRPKSPPEEFEVFGEPREPGRSLPKPCKLSINPAGTIKAYAGTLALESTGPAEGKAMLLGRRDATGRLDQTHSLYSFPLNPA